MALTENDCFAIAAEAFEGEVPITPQEQFVTSVYSAVDEATADGVARLRREQGIVPACKRGCCYCCRYHIVTNIAEAHTLVQYIKRRFSTDQIVELRRRTEYWHAWDNSRPGRHPVPSVAPPIDLFRDDPFCPLLVDGACSVYPVRPVACRTHFVHSHPRLCRAASDPEATHDAPAVLKSVVKAAGPSARALRDLIEHAGLDFSRSLTLLPHALAHHMAWDFAVAS